MHKIEDNFTCTLLRISGELVVIPKIFFIFYELDQLIPSDISGGLFDDLQILKVDMGWSKSTFIWHF